MLREAAMPEPGNGVRGNGVVETSSGRTGVGNAIKTDFTPTHNSVRL